MYTPSLLLTSPTDKPNDQRSRVICDSARMEYAYTSVPYRTSQRQTRQSALASELASICGEAQCKSVLSNGRPKQFGVHVSRHVPLKLIIGGCAT